jgi:hypothetical protein
MLNAYVGIASKHGLNAFRLERPDTLDWVRQSARGRTWPPRVAFWAVLSDREAFRISWLLDRGERREALRHLGQAAREIGRILPGDGLALH